MLLRCTSTFIPHPFFPSLLQQFEPGLRFFDAFLAERRLEFLRVELRGKRGKGRLRDAFYVRRFARHRPGRGAPSQRRRGSALRNFGAALFEIFCFRSRKCCVTASPPTGVSRRTSTVSLHDPRTFSHLLLAPQRVVLAVVCHLRSSGMEPRLGRGSRKISSRTRTIVSSRNSSRPPERAQKRLVVFRFVPQTATGWGLVRRVVVIRTLLGYVPVPDKAVVHLGGSRGNCASVARRRP
mmetsp:Transcript_14032/g.46487  ORF Transcript_14032/g.46487 Transcript_14032/m.46487 type:complete len:238 (-) Transcript_14032:203-916(-)